MDTLSSFVLNKARQEAVGAIRAGDSQLLSLSSFPPLCHTTSHPLTHPDRSQHLQKCQIHTPITWLHTNPSCLPGPQQLPSPQLIFPQPRPSQGELEMDVGWLQGW